MSYKLYCKHGKGDILDKINVSGFILHLSGLSKLSQIIKFAFTNFLWVIEKTILLVYTSIICLLISSAYIMYVKVWFKREADTKPEAALGML